MRLNVFSWNVLSDAYFTPEDYPTYEKSYFDSERKQEQVLQQLKRVMKSNTLIALQEVCSRLMPELVKLALNMNYVIRDAYYGNEKSGNMGVVLMWPNNIYRVEKYEQIIVGQHITTEPPTVYQSWWDWLRRVPPPNCPLKYAKLRSKFNVICSKKSHIPFFICCISSFDKTFGIIATPNSFNVSFKLFLTIYFLKIYSSSFIVNRKNPESIFFHIVSKFMLSYLSLLKTLTSVLGFINIFI